MSETHDHCLAVSQEEKPQFPLPNSSSLCFLLATLSDSLKVLLRTGHLFLLIFLSLTLPLSLLLFSLSLSSRPLKRHILYLESIALRSPTRFEARQVWKESREDSLSLLRLKFLFFIPCSFLSLISSISSVHATYLSLSRSRPSLTSSATAIKLAWKRVVVTSFCSYLLFLLYVQIPELLAAAFNNHSRTRLLILLAGAGFEVYLMAVVAMGLVVSVLEERFGWDAIRVGSGLMEGRKICGWLLSGLLVAVSGWIGREFEASTEEGMDEKRNKRSGWAMWAAVTGLACLYAVALLWSYVVTTVFYCQCRKRHVSDLWASENESECGTDKL